MKIILLFLIIILVFLSIFGAIWHILVKKKTIYLTFDDGPQGESTEKILRILDRENVKATFFCSGSMVAKYPDAFENIKAGGHQVGCHGMNHLNGWKTNNKTYFKDMEEANKLINSHLLRPPYGRIKPSQWFHLRKKYRIIFWTSLSYDWKQDFDYQKCLQRVKRESKFGGIVVFHDTHKTMEKLAAALPLFIQEAKKNGLIFKTFNQ